MTRAQIEAKIAARETGVANRIAAERELWTIFMNEVCKLYEVKEIDVNLTLNPDFLTDNFDSTGLGKSTGEYYGFAICNGENGTQDRTGRTGVGYGVGYTDIGELIGSADSVVVSHTHTTVPNTNIEFGSGDSVVRSRVPAVTAGVGNPINVTVASTGVSGLGKNIPPSIITLMIQRIA